MFAASKLVNRILCNCFVFFLHNFGASTSVWEILQKLHDLRYDFEHSTKRNDLISRIRNVLMTLIARGDYIKNARMLRCFQRDS